MSLPKGGDTLTWTRMKVDVPVTRTLNRDVTTERRHWPTSGLDRFVTRGKGRDRLVGGLFSAFRPIQCTKTNNCRPHLWFDTVYMGNQL